MGEALVDGSALALVFLAAPPLQPIGTALDDRLRPIAAAAIYYDVLDLNAHLLPHRAQAFLQIGGLLVAGGDDRDAHGPKIGMAGVRKDKTLFRTAFTHYSGNSSARDNCSWKLDLVRQARTRATRKVKQQSGESSLLSH